MIGGATIHLSGKFLTGDPVMIIDRFIEDATWLVGAQALADVHEILDAKIRNPTPYYETQLMVERMAPDMVKMHDRGVVYGPWLEGTGSRNKTTQFKGYKAFRTTTQRLGRQVPQIVAPLMPGLYRELGG